MHRAARGCYVVSRVLRPTSTGGVQSEDTLLLPSESEAPMVRRPEGVSGSVAMAIRWDCHGVQPGISTLLPLFRDSLPSTLLSRPLSSFSLSLAPRSLALLLRVPPFATLTGSPPFAFFSHVYIRIHSATLPVRPLVPSSPLFVLDGPFASFVPRLTPFQQRQRWLDG